MADDPTTTDPAPEPQPDPAPADPAPDPGAKPEIDWKAKARMWEDRAKTNSAAAKKLADLEAASQTETERAQAAAKAAEDRAQAAVLRIASAEVRAALTGIVPDPAAVAEDLNLAKFLTDDGEVDAEKVAALRTKYQALAPSGPRAPLPNPAQGNGSANRSLGELVADAEKSGDPRRSIKHKSRQLLELRKQQG